MSVETAPVPYTIERLRRQNGALRTLNKWLQDQCDIHSAKAQLYWEAAQSLDSEREANAQLTAEIDRLTGERDALKAQKWDVKHVDTMNDMVAMGLAREDAEERAQSAEQRLADQEAALRDPSVVHLNMLRGGIAKPSPANIWHIYGGALMEAMPGHLRADIIEQCAKVADEQRTDDDSMWDRAAKLISDEIRALAQAPTPPERNDGC